MRHITKNVSFLVSLVPTQKESHDNPIDKQKPLTLYI